MKNLNMPPKLGGGDEDMDYKSLYYYLTGQMSVTVEVLNLASENLVSSSDTAVFASESNILTAKNTAAEIVLKAKNDAEEAALSAKNEAEEAKNCAEQAELIAKNYAKQAELEAQNAIKEAEAVAATVKSAIESVRETAKAVAEVRDKMKSMLVREIPVIEDKNDEQ
ncbi:MAG: hypothetical protein LBR54_02490 [Oscillospiraceae bacterium]|jgi:phage terminase Nu1 subunit (DNA packaging protein)|nr:hypothetical protein [Oscillospiraceae bacterium]